ncbi:MAG: ParA family protein [Bacteroides sp.]|nr:ParA family protein [Bacteroides sp.]
MGQILPGVAFENPKGGVGKSTLTALFAGYIHSQSNEEGGLSIAVVDIDDMQNTIGKLREDEAEDGIMKKEEEYEVINISSSEFINQLDFLQDNYDIILVDFPGNLKQNGVVETLHFVDVIIIPFEPNQTDLRPTLTLSKAYHHPCDAFCEEVLELICNHIGE